MNRLRSERRQGSSPASRRASHVLDRFFPLALISVIKGADAPFFLEKSVTYVLEQALPMSQVYRQLRRGRVGLFRHFMCKAT